MGFYRYDTDGKIRPRNNKPLDCQQAILDGEEIRVEQSHKEEVDINNIIRKHGVELIERTAALQEFRYDDVTGNDFQESLHAIMQAKESFGALPAVVRREFDNDPVKFMDYIHNPDNHQQLIDWGLKNPEDLPPQPLQVVMVDTEGNPVHPVPETPPEIP